MKKLITLLVSLAILGGLVYLAFAPKPGGEVLGKPIPEGKEVTPIGDILKDGSYVGKKVLVEGKIVDQ